MIYKYSGFGFRVIHLPCNSIIITYKSNAKITSIINKLETKKQRKMGNITIEKKRDRYQVFIHGPCKS